MQTGGFAIEIGAMNYGFDLDGMIGLDLLQQLKAIINIHECSQIVNDKYNRRTSILVIFFNSSYP
jgi:hypothetical protein